MKEFTDTELAQEQWRDIEGYEGVYQVSDLGRVRSRYSGEWRVLKPRNNGNGYLRVWLYKNGNGKCLYIHRLVAHAFIENDDESKIYINHIDECKQNNRVINLEYCTAQYNTNYNDVQFRKMNSVRRKVKDLYDQNLTYEQNIEIFRANGVECSERVIRDLRRDLGIYRKYTKRS